MKISCDWLQDYVDVQIDPIALADMLTMAGLEVESIERIGMIPDGVIVGQVVSVTKHPDADRLTVCQVDVGAQETLQIVCGAPNVAEGQMVPVATEGTVLTMPDRKNPGKSVRVDIRKSKIRGSLSQGMICAEDELGLSEDHTGIMVLDPGATPGSAFSSYLKSVGRLHADTVMDIAVTPNRPDATSHIGVARDVSALTKLALRPPSLGVPTTPGEAAKRIKVRIEDETLCRRYAAIVVEDVKIGESPDWLKRRLESVGLRPRNIVVDVTNYVMYECGQPLHAFDLDSIGGAQIIVRATAAKSRFTTLDGISRDLPAGTLMICDADREVAIAGVMGGQNSEVSNNTTTILIESAYFSPSSIRKTAKALNLQTDASYRFERGVDSAGQVWAAARAAALIADLARARIVQGVVDAHPSPIIRREVDLRISRIGTILGVDVPKNVAIRLLEAIGFQLLSESDTSATFLVPSHRPDVEREIDLIEEVARLHGYDQIREPDTTPVPSFTPRDRTDDLARQKVLSLASGWGYREIYTNSLIAKETAQAYCVPEILGDLSDGTPVTTANPITREMTTLRPSLLPGALEVVRHNLNHGQSSVRVIEFGHVFTRQDLPANIIPGYEEHDALLLACAGVSGTRHWGASSRRMDLFDVKGAIASIFSALGVDGLSEMEFSEAADVTQMRVDFFANGTRIGTAAQLHVNRAADIGLEEEVFFAELNWSRLLERSTVGVNVPYADISRFPTVERDLAFVVNASQDVGPILDTVRREGAPLLADVGVFDVYQGKNVGANLKSVAFWLHFSADRTLKDEEVERQIDRIISSVRKAYLAELRD